MSECQERCRREVEELKTQQEENIRILLAGNEERMERMARENRDRMDRCEICFIGVDEQNKYL